MATVTTLALGSLHLRAQSVADFVDEFSGPELDPTWAQLGTGGTFVGFVNNGYLVSFPSSGAPDTGLTRHLDGTTNGAPSQVTNSFTIDATVQLDGLTGQSGQFKLRFFGGQFMEVVYNLSTDSIRVFSAERGGNLVNVGGLGLPAAGGILNLRVSRDVTTGTVVVGYSVGTGTPLKVLTSTSGLKNFTPNTCDMVMNRSSGLPIVTPSMLIDRYEQRAGVFGISIDPFVDTFDGPALAPSWDLVQSQPSDHVGFTGAGQYEITKTTTAGEAGLSRDFGGQDTFNSSIVFQVEDFVGSGSQVEFRHPTAFGGVTVTLNSDRNIVVSSDFVPMVALENFGYQDGETLEFVVSEDAVSGEAQIGLRRNGGMLLQIANISGLTELPSKNEIVLTKVTNGNGNSPRLLLDDYSIQEGVRTIEAAAFTDDFSGPTLDSGWMVSDTGTGSHVGFNGMGQYEISPQAAGISAGLRRFLGMAGDVTIDVRARLNNFLGSDSEFRLQIPGLNGVQIIIKSDGIIEVFSAETSSTVLSTESGLSDGDLFDLRLTIDRNDPTFSGVYEVGLGLNGGPLTFLVDDFNLVNLDPVQAEVLITKNGEGNGSQPSLLLDRFSVSEGFNSIPEQVEPFSDDFSFLDPGWNPVGLTHLGPNGEGQYVIQVDTNASVNINRLLAPNGIPEIPVGSFTMRLDVKFLQLAGEGAPGSGTDCKIKIEGGNLMEIVFNSFKTVRFFTQNNGQNWFQDTLTEFNDGDTVNFGIVYDASVPSVTMSVGLNGGPAIFKETRSGLVGVAPQILKINGFRFNFDNFPDLVPQFLVDQLDLTPGLEGLPGTLSIQEAYGGRVQIEWDAGRLQAAPAPDGVFSDVPMATSPYLRLPSGEQEYYRTQN